MVQNLLKGKITNKIKTIDFSPLKVALRTPCVYTFTCNNKVVYAGQSGRANCQSRTNEHIRNFKTFTTNREIYSGVQKAICENYGDDGCHDMCIIKHCAEGDFTMWASQVDFSKATLDETEKFLIDTYTPTCNRVIYPDRKSVNGRVHAFHVGDVKISMWSI